MKFAFYLFIFAQILNSLGIFAEKVLKDPSEGNTINWEKVKKNKNRPLEKIIWKSYKEEENFFKNENEEGIQTGEINAAWVEPSIWRNRLW